MLRSHVALLFIHIYVSIINVRRRNNRVKVEVLIYGGVFHLCSMFDALKCFGTLKYVVLTVDNYLESVIFLWVILLIKYGLKKGVTRLD
jgi:hypothetical protein